MVAFIEDVMKSCMTYKREEDSSVHSTTNKSLEQLRKPTALYASLVKVDISFFLGSTGSLGSGGGSEAALPPLLLAPEC